MLSFHALEQLDGIGQFLRCAVKGDVWCPSSPGEFHRALPLHIERMSLVCTSITTVGQELMSDGVGSDRALPWTCAAACKAVKSFPCFLLEWEKSIPSTDSIHHSRRFPSRQDVSSSALKSESTRLSASRNALLHWSHSLSQVGM